MLKKHRILVSKSSQQALIDLPEDATDEQITQVEKDNPLPERIKTARDLHFEQRQKDLKEFSDNIQL